MKKKMQGRLFKNVSARNDFTEDPKFPFEIRLSSDANEVTDFNMEDE